MNRQTYRELVPVGVVLAAALGGALLIGALESHSAQAGAANRFAAGESAFVLSAGTIGDAPGGAEDIAQAMARQPSGREAVVASF